MDIVEVAQKTRECAGSVSYAKQDVDGATLEHAIWMLQGIIEGYVTGEKAHRWLGYAQALVVVIGGVPLDGLLEINRGETL